MHISVYRPRRIAAFLLVTAAVVQSISSVWARELTLDEAMDMAVNKSSRGSIIKGDLEVAQQNYFAERINFYIPEISINGNAPIYNVNESFRFFGGLSQKQLIRTTDLDFKTYIQLQQSLITGGNLTATGNLWRTRSRYPITSQGLMDVTEISQQGVFDFSFEQPILKPSEPKYQLNNRKDDLEIARIARAEAEAGLRKEVVEAYFGVIQSAIELDISNDNVESAQLQEQIDSSKFADSILAEATYLESSSAKLDAELDQFDKENQQVQKKRELALLLDLDPSEALDPTIPALSGHLSDREKTTLVNNWELSAPILKARYNYNKAERSANYTASSHGLAGTFQANYQLGRGDVEVEDVKASNNTNSWGISLNFTLPLWDGGSTGATIKAARLTAEKSELEYTRARKTAKAEIVNLINRLDVSYRKMDVLDKQIAINKKNLGIAEFRMNDGQISKIEYLESAVSYQESRNKYIEELKKYLLDKIDLETKYPD